MTIESTIHQWASRQICFHSRIGYPRLPQFVRKPTRHRVTDNAELLGTSNFALTLWHNIALELGGRRRGAPGGEEVFEDQTNSSVNGSAGRGLLTPGGYLGTAGCDVIYLVTGYGQPIPSVLTSFTFKGPATSTGYIQKQLRAASN